MNFIIVTAELIQSIRDCAETSSFKQSENQCAETNTLKSSDISQTSFMLQAYAYQTLFHDSNMVVFILSENIHPALSRLFLSSTKSQFLLYFAWSHIIV